MGTGEYSGSSGCKYNGPIHDLVRRLLTWGIRKVIDGIRRTTRGRTRRMFLLKLGEKAIISGQAYHMVSPEKQTFCSPRHIGHACFHHSTHAPPGMDGTC